MKYAEQVNPWTQKADSWSPGLEGGKDKDSLLSGYGVFFVGNENFWELNKGGGCTTSLPNLLDGTG